MFVSLEQWWMSGQWGGAPVVEPPAAEAMPGSVGGRRAGFEQFIQPHIPPRVVDDLDDEAAIAVALLLLHRL